MRLLPAFVSLAVAALALSGCLSGPGPATPTDGPAAGTPPAPVPYVGGKDGPLPRSAYPGELPVMEERYVGQRGGGEPTIAVNRDGVAVYPSIAFDINGVATSLASTRVMVSTDEGRTWEDRSPVLAGGNGLPAVRPNPTSLDPYVYADPATGRVYNIDLNLALGGFLSWTDDGGRTWVSNPGCCGLPVDDHQTLFSGPPTTLVPVSPLYSRILYFCVNQVGAASCTHSLDGGLTWSDGTPAYRGLEPPSEEREDCVPDPLTGDLGDCFCGGLHGHGHASEKTGTVFLPKGHCGQAVVARSTDNGLTFSTVVVDRTYGVDGHEAIVSTDKAGNVYYFFLDRNALPRLAISRDDGLTWSTPINVTVPGVTAAKFPSIVAGDAGRIAFLYVGTTTPHGHDVGDRHENGTLMYPSELDNATWSGYVGFSVNADSEDPVFATVTAHDPADPLARGACQGRCQAANGGMYDFLDIDIHPLTGQVWVALVDNCNDDTPYNSPPCNGPLGTAKSYQRARAAVGVQVGGTMLGSRLP